MAERSRIPHRSSSSLHRDAQRLVLAPDARSPPTFFVGTHDHDIVGGHSLAGYETRHEISMTPSPRVTVIIATYNWSTVLRYAIASVLGQTMRDLELLVVGDGCTDDSEQVVTAMDDPRVRWINLPANTGHQSGPNNRGLQEAKGEFIAYLGHDDLWLPHHLECTTDLLDETDSAVAHTLLIRVRPGRSVGSPVVPMPQYGYGGPPSCTVHRRSVTERIGGWGDYRTLNVAPEADLFRRALAAGFKAVFAPRLSVIKFPASQRRDVYRERPSHEQATWWERIRSDPNFEAVQLVEMIVTDETTRAVPARRLVRILGQELRRRLAWRLSPTSGLRAMFWQARGGGIDVIRKFKGL
jgi:glycosyltransferase involved in cell wall biosynthesis